MTPKATHEFHDLPAALDFLKRTRWELRSLRRAHVWSDRLQVFDVNGDYFEVRGVGYAHDEIAPLLRAVNAAFDPDDDPPAAAGRIPRAGHRPEARVGGRSRDVTSCPLSPVRGGEG